MPVLGYGVNTPNRLRLWSAEAPETFDFAAFNAGNYYQAVDAQIRSETITKVLYPNDETEAGQELRLEQQYFFVACSLQDMIRLQLQRERISITSTRSSSSSSTIRIRRSPWRN
jgi:starch phosphorylase